MVVMLFANSILSVQLESMGVPDHSIGFIMALAALTYAITSPLIGLFKGVPRRYITFVAFLISIVGLFMLGPSKLLGFPRSLGLLIGGLCLGGIAVSLIVVPLLPEIIDAVKEKENLGEYQILNDKASAVYNTS